MGLVDGRICRQAPLLTYANIGVFAPALFDGINASRAPLFPWLYRFVEHGRVGGEHFRGRWHNVGTVEDLFRLDAELAASRAMPLRESG
jgi:MurNAc alpha-1-phosphate uridylyltransferase